MISNPISMDHHQQTELIHLCRTKSPFLVNLLETLVVEVNSSPGTTGMLSGHLFKHWRKFLSDLARRSPVQGLFKDPETMYQILGSMLESHTVPQLNVFRHLYPVLGNLLVIERMTVNPDHPKWTLLDPILMELRLRCMYLEICQITTLWMNMFLMSPPTIYSIRLGSHDPLCAEEWPLTKMQQIMQPRNAVQKPPLSIGFVYQGY